MTTTAASPRSPSLMAVLLLASIVLTLASAELETDSPPSSCADELVHFSPCLSYVAAPPNNISDSPASKCCEAFSSAEESGRAVCLCYLVQDPPMLGFPVTVDRVLSLSSLCRTRSSAADSTSLKSLCSESPDLPPLRNSTIPAVISGPPPPPPGPETASSSSPKPSTKPSFSAPPSSAIEPARGSAAEPARGSAAEAPGVASEATMDRIFDNDTSWLLPALVMFLLI